MLIYMCKLKWIGLKWVLYSVFCGSQSVGQNPKWVAKPQVLGLKMISGGKKKVKIASF